MWVCSNRLCLPTVWFAIVLDSGNPRKWWYAKTTQSLIYKKHFWSIWFQKIEWHFTCFVKLADFYMMAGCSFILSLIQILQRKIEGEKLCVKSWHRRMEKSEKQVFIKVEKSAKLSRYQIRYFLLPWPLGNVTRTGEKGGWTTEMEKPANLGNTSVSANLSDSVL